MIGLILSDLNVGDKVILLKCRKMIGITTITEISDNRCYTLENGEVYDEMGVLLNDIKSRKIINAWTPERENDFAERIHRSSMIDMIEDFDFDTLTTDELEKICGII